MAAIDAALIGELARLRRAQPMPRSRPLVALSLVVALVGQASAALADPPAKTLRLIGDAPTAVDPAPKAFVIDIAVSDGDSEAQTSLDGWLASTAAPAASGPASGACVETHCTLTADLDGQKLTVTGDFGAAAGPVAAHFTFKDSDGKVVSEGAAALKPLNGDVPGLGALAGPGAVNAAELDELLLWSHETTASGSPPGDDPPDSIQRDTLATWQGQQGRLATGLIFSADLTQLHGAEADAKKVADWTALGDAAHGWRAGYPAALLPNATHPAGKAGPEQRFASADGKAVLVVAVDPPMSDADFDAFEEKLTADRDSRSGVNMTRVNGDLQLRYVEGGLVTVEAYHSRAGGLARLEFTYPDEGGDAYAPYELILQHSLVVTDDLKP
jgi:hypothetical protein